MEDEDDMILIYSILKVLEWLVLLAKIQSGGGVHLNTFVLRNPVSLKIPFTDGVVSRDHRSSAQLHLHSGQPNLSTLI